MHKRIVSDTKRRKKLKLNHEKAFTKVALMIKYLEMSRTLLYKHGKTNAIC